MKVALCYSGLVRNFLDCINSHKQFIINKLNPDIFIHTWSKIGSNKLPHWYNSNYNVNQHIDEIELQKNLDIQQINTLYSPKQIVVEYPDIQHFYDRFYDNSYPSFFNNVMMHYGVCRSNTLKSDYEHTHNFKYDMVIRCRFDLFFEDVVFHNESINDIAHNNAIYLAPNENIDIPFTEAMKKLLEKQGIKYMPNDQFAYGNSSAMDYYSSVYNIFEKDYNFYYKHAEGILTQHLWTKNISEFNNIKINNSVKMRIQSRYWR